jgi:hypothetical protein
LHSVSPTQDKFTHKLLYFVIVIHKLLELMVEKPCGCRLGRTWKGGRLHPYLMKEVEAAKFTSIEDVVTFVKWLGPRFG